MTPGTCIEWWIVKRLTGAPDVIRECPGGVHPFPVPSQIRQPYIEFRMLPGAQNENGMCGQVTLSDISYEIFVAADTGSRGNMPLVKAQTALIATLATGYIEESATIVPDLGTVPAMLVEWIEEIREPELREGGGIRRRLGGVYRFRVSPNS